MWRSELLRAGVHYTHAGTTQADGTVTPLPDDAFTRWRNGVELRHVFGPPFRERHAEVGIYGIIDIYSDAPFRACHAASVRARCSTRGA